MLKQHWRAGPCSSLSSPWSHSVYFGVAQEASFVGNDAANCHQHGSTLCPTPPHKADWLEAADMYVCAYAEVVLTQCTHVYSTINIDSKDNNYL